jgi:hypothetical protein
VTEQYIASLQFEVLPEYEQNQNDLTSERWLTLHLIIFLKYFSRNSDFDMENAVEFEPVPSSFADDLFSNENIVQESST